MDEQTRKALELAKETLDNLVEMSPTIWAIRAQDKAIDAIDAALSAPAAQVAQSVSHAEWLALPYTQALIEQVRDLSSKVAPAAPVARTDGMPESRSERHLRRLLAARVAMPGTYLDDGEASGAEHGITIDFMREPVADIDAKLRALNVARAECAALADPVTLRAMSAETRIGKLMRDPEFQARLREELREVDASVAAALAAPVAQVCTYPECNCPFDAPADPNWCARGLPHAATVARGFGITKI